ncbi:lysozyme family protein [Sphingomonas qomolangmaensis]|uniref:Large polyvalent protein-associated domain-containing protein n=1 Tax=Sphingomonas qomolangmaensis TaxID=2918765 RepID=A0ABY5LBF4_9SPHN|nr:hypothetical protein [Sphingomonas qomolangmaensis]UUL83451.1 hypothetical protein NMP03_04270 [Sphingomonas qomolangmaensis]
MEMSQDRRPRDPLSFYEVDLEAQPRAQPEAMPRSSWSETFTSSFRVVQDDWPSQSEQEVVNDYGPLVEALQAETGRSMNSYVSTGRGGGSVYEQRVFEDLAAVRARKPDFMKGTPTTVDEFRAATLKRVQERRAADQRTVERGGTVAWGAGSLAAGVLDPFNLLTAPIGGGGGTTIARRILNQAVIGATTEAVEQPLIANERAKRGETLTGTEAAANIGTAGVGAGVLQGGGELVVRGASRLAGPVADLIESFKARVGLDSATPAERAAVGELEREVEIAATSPFNPGRDSERHAARLNAAERALDNPASIPPTAPPPPVSRDAYYRRLRGAESGGNDAARNTRSTATGRYQFLDSTWLTYHKRVVGGTMSDAQRLAQRSDGGLQDRLMQVLTNDNAASLARVGARETGGNLYLMHVFGQGGGQAILRAGRDAPIEAIVGRKVVEANPFLRGRTVGDTIEWAHSRMGEAPDTAPTLRRDQFDADEEWATAQRAVDAEEAALARADADIEDVVQTAERRWTAIADDPAPQAVDIGGTDSARLYRSAGDDTRAFETEAEAIAIAGGGDVVPVDVPRAILDDIAPVAPDAAGARVRSIDPAAADAWRAPRERTAPAARPEPDLLQGQATVIRAGDLIRDASSIQRAYVISPDGKIYLLNDGVSHDAFAAEAGATDLSGFAAITTFGGELALRRSARPSAQQNRIIARLSATAAREGRDVTEGGLTGNVGVAFPPRGDAPVALAGRDSAPPSRETLARYDDPFDSATPRSLDETIEHDVRMIAVEAPDTPVRLSDEGEVARLADVLQDLDDDAAAILAARACMVP